MKRTLCVVLERRRSAEHRHDGVPGELLYGPARALNLFRHRVVEPFEQCSRSLRILRAAELGRADQVCEEHGRELSFLDVHA